MPCAVDAPGMSLVATPGFRRPALATRLRGRPFTSGQFGPLVCDLVPGNPFVSRAPVDLDLDSGLLLAQDRYRLSCLDGVGLAGSGLGIHLQRHDASCSQPFHQELTLDAKPTLTVYGMTRC